MLNIIKMDLYRMFRSKSLYIIWIIMALMLTFTTVISGMAVDSGKAYLEAEAPADINIGMSVDVKLEQGVKVSVFALLYGNTQPQLLALFFTIFAVIFSTADINSGFIKSIGGQVKNRMLLVFSKAVCLSLYAVLSMLAAVLVQTILNFFVFGYVTFGNLNDFMAYMGVQTLLHISIVLLCMMIALVLRSNLVSMILVVCMNMNIMSLLYMGIDTILSKLGVKNFSITEYTITGRITLLSDAPGREECITSIIVALIFGVTATAIAGIVFKKRDI